MEIVHRNGFTIKDVFHIKIRQPLLRLKRGVQYKLLCPHYSSNLWTKTVSLPARRQSGSEALDEIIELLNGNRAALDPFITVPINFEPVRKLGNRLDPNTANDYIFESVKLQTAIEEITRIELNPVEGGGSFEPMFVRFKSQYDHVTRQGLDMVVLQAFEQGYTASATDPTVFSSTPKVTLHHDLEDFATRPNLLSVEGNLITEQGTNLIALGSKKEGTYPTDFSKYFGSREVFNSARDWKSGNRYRVGSLVRFDEVRYECIREHIANITRGPTNNSFWRSRAFVKPAQWNDVITYDIHAVIRDNDIAYRCKQAHNSSPLTRPPNVTYWQRISYLPTTDYSPLTKDKAQYWINALGGGKYAASSGPNQNNPNNKTVIVDPNVIIKDARHPRTWVDRVTNDPGNIPSTEMLDGNKFVHTYRVLVVNPATGEEQGLGAWSGADSQGITYAGRIAEWDDENGDGVGEWRVMVKRHMRCNEDQEIYEWNEDVSWTKNPLEGDGFIFDGADVNGTRGNTWKKGGYAISEFAIFNGIAHLFTEEGLSQIFTGDLSGFNGKKVGRFIPLLSFNCTHAVDWDPLLNRIVCGNETGKHAEDPGTSTVFIQTDPVTLTQKYTQFIGLNFAFPWPRTSNAIPYGSVSIGEKIRVVPFDFFNMNYTHDHKREWFGSQVEDYYPIRSFAFLQNFTRQESFVTILRDAATDIEMVMWHSDRYDNVITLDYKHDRNRDTLPIEVPLSPKNYYYGVPGNSALVGSQEPDTFEVFDSRQVVRGGIYTKDSFDKQGRYLGVRSTFQATSRLRLSVDAFRMTKPLVCTNVDTSASKPTRNIEPQKIIAENLVHYQQLKNYVLGLERWYNFVRDSYVVSTPGRCDIDFGDPVYLELKQLVPDVTHTKASTIRLTAEKIVYSISKPKVGPGGFTRTVHLTKRLYPEEDINN